MPLRPDDDIGTVEFHQREETVQFPRIKISVTIDEGYVSATGTGHPHSKRNALSPPPRVVHDINRFNPLKDVGSAAVRAAVRYDNDFIGPTRFVERRHDGPNVLRKPLTAVVRGDYQRQFGL